MKITVLMDNNAPADLTCEWGLSVLIERGDACILLDAGASPAFVRNAAELGIDLDRVDYAVLSHAHFDHADGMPAFFGANDHAKLFLRAGAAENCWAIKEGKDEYIGIVRGMLDSFQDRIEYVEGDFELCPGVWLIPHKADNLAEEGARQNMLIEPQPGAALVPDDFAHEHSLVIEEAGGVVIFSSCTHGGADAVIDEVARTFPGKPVRALIGGLHLFLDPPERVRNLAKRLRETGVELIMTGHCTGDAAIAILREELGDVVQQFQVGLTLEI